MQSVTPECTHSGLGSSAFARRYLRNRVFFLFLRVLRCFSSPGSLPYVMDWRMDTWGLLMWVSPFRHLRINGYLLLPEAYRSLSRLSSAPSAKAFALRPCSLDLSNVLSEHLVSSWFSLLPTKIIVTLPFEIAIFLKRTYYNLCFAVIIQFSNGGAQFNAGKGLSNENQQSAILGAVAGAKHIHTLAEAYGATVILHTDHCAKNLLPWIDGLLDASEKHFAETGKSLFRDRKSTRLNSSH